MAKQTYAQRIINFLKKYPGALLKQARGYHAEEVKSEHTLPGERDQYLESYQRTLRTKSDIKQLLKPFKGDYDLLVVISGCVTCPSAPGTERGECPEQSYFDTLSHWNSVKDIQEWTKHPGSLVDFAEEMIPFDCWTGEPGHWVSVK